MLKQNKREGLTKITSVSVSKEFAELVERYNLSPTDVFRKGIAVTLCDLGIDMYKTDLNISRTKYVKEFFKIIEEEERLREFFDRLVEFAKETKNI